MEVETKMADKFIIKSFKENDEFVGYLSAYSASGMNQFAPQMIQAILFNTKEECIYSDGQIWEEGRGGGKGYYKIEKVTEYDSEKSNDLKIPAFIKYRYMKLIITVNNKSDKAWLKLFGARHNYIQANFGNNHNIEIKNVECDENYEKNIGGFKDIEWAKYSSMLHDFVKHDIRVLSINGEPLKREIKGSNPIEYEIIEELNPYSQEYIYELNKNGEHKLEILLKLY